MGHLKGSCPTSAELRLQEGLSLLPGSFLQRLAELPTERKCKRHRNSIADLAMLVVHVAIEAEAVGKALHVHANKQSYF